MWKTRQFSTIFSHLGSDRSDPNTYYLGEVGALSSLRIGLSPSFELLGTEQRGEAHVGTPRRGRITQLSRNQKAMKPMKMSVSSVIP